MNNSWDIISNVCGWCLIVGIGCIAALILTATLWMCVSMMGGL